MPRLLVLRGEKLDREIPLGRQTIRIGRGDQNDLVLEDPGKSVSRNHAEIRYEGGRYVLADLESQNGVWVSGSRVPYVVLEPRIVASIGPFRLMLEPDGPATDPGAEDLPPDATYYGEGGGTQSQIVAPGRSSGQRAAAAAQPASWMAANGKWLALGGAALVLALGAFVAVKLAGGGSTEKPPIDVAALLATAQKQIDQGDCSLALSESIDPVLSLDPANAEAAKLKAMAESCAPPPPTPPPADPNHLTPEEITARLQSAREAIAARDCAGAIAQLGPVLEQDPENPDAKDLKAQAESCPPARPSNPTPQPAVRQALAVRVAPENGGLEPLPGELDRDYQPRVRGMRARYDDAVALVGAGAYTRAIPQLESIVREASARYLDVAAKLTEARKGAARQAYADAQAREGRDEYDPAIQAYRRARELDPDLKVDDDIRRLTEKRLQLGQKACDDAKNAYALTRNQEALRLYNEVLKLLPQDHQCYAIAKERVAQLSR